MAHSTHLDILPRLKRAEGHLRSTIAMIEEGRACLDIVQQLRAVENAISNAKKSLVHDHIDHCLERAVQEKTQTANQAIQEFKAITKYL